MEFHGLASLRMIRDLGEANWSLSSTLEASDMLTQLSIPLK